MQSSVNMQLHNSLYLYKKGKPDKLNHDGVKNSIKGDLRPKFHSCFLYIFLLLVRKRFLWSYFISRTLSRNFWKMTVQEKTRKNVTAPLPSQCANKNQLDTMGRCEHLLGSSSKTTSGDQWQRHGSGSYLKVSNAWK